MSRHIAFPFLTLDREAVAFSGWYIGDPDGPREEAGPILPNWDYARDLEVSGTLSIDWMKAATSLQLHPATLKLRLVLTVGTGAGNLPRRQHKVFDIVMDSSSMEIDVVAQVSGRELSGRLRLSLQILLEGPVSQGTILSPNLRGSKLWRSHYDILLEDGGESRFPVETTSFSKSFRGKQFEHAPWYLHWRPDSFQADFSSNVRLYINADRGEALNRFAGGDSITLQAIMSDVVAQMIAPVLDHADGAALLAECEEGSVGQQVQRWIEMAFPGQEIPSVRVLRTSQPGAFHASILSIADMGDDE